MESMSNTKNHELVRFGNYFLGMLNDLKRRPKDAAKELNISLEDIMDIIVISIFNENRFFSIPSTLVALGSLVLGIMLLLMSVVLFSIARMSKRI